jgi:hypothetical protein
MLWLLSLMLSEAAVGESDLMCSIVHTQQLSLCGLNVKPRAVSYNFIEPHSAMSMVEMYGL